MAANSAPSDAPRSEVYTWGEVIQMIARHRRELIAANVIAVLGAMAAVPVPLLIPLLVDEVLGQRHFLDSDALPAELDDDSPLKGVVARQHRLGSETWYELDLDRLFTSPEFLHGSAD